MRPVQSAERHVKFPSSPMAPGRFIAAIATRSISQPGRPEDTKPKDRFMRFSFIPDSDSNSSWIVGAGQLNGPAGLIFLADLTSECFFIIIGLSLFDIFP